MTKSETVKAFKKIAKKLEKMQVAASAHVSRKDNRELFEMRWFFKNLAKRVENEYEDETRGADGRKYGNKDR